METKASHILIGTFMLLLIAALFAFVLWLSRTNSDNRRQFDVFFENSVTGLDVGSVVRFNGVPVGQVRAITLAPNDPTKVRVRLSIIPEAPILQGAVATLDVQGLTGLAFVQIAGGDKNAPPIEKIGPYGAPIIPTSASSLQALFGGAPELLQQATITTTSLNALLNDQNRAALAATLKNLEQLSQSLVPISATLPPALTALSTAAQQVSALSTSAQGTLNGPGTALLQETRALMVQGQQTLTKVDAIVAENGQGLQQFSATTLPELTQLVSDLRTLTHSLTTVSQGFEEGGLSTLLQSEKGQDYDPHP